MAESDAEKERKRLLEQRARELEAEARAANLSGAQLEAGRTQKEATDRAIAEQREAADRQWLAAEKGIERFENYMGQAGFETQEWRESGRWAISDLTSKMKSGYFSATLPDLPEWQGFTADDMEEDPGYRFRLEQGEEALLRGANRGVGVDSGSTRKALLEFGQKMGSQEFGRARERALTDYRIGRGEALEEYDLEQKSLDREFGQLTGLADRGRAASESYLRHVAAGTSGAAEMGRYGADARMGAATRIGALDIAGANALAASEVGAATTEYGARMIEDERAYIDEMYQKYPQLLTAPRSSSGGGSNWIGYLTAGVNLVDKMSAWF